MRGVNSYCYYLHHSFSRLELTPEAMLHQVALLAHIIAPWRQKPHGNFFFFFFSFSFFSFFFFEPDWEQPVILRPPDCVTVVASLKRSESAPWLTFADSEPSEFLLDVDLLCEKASFTVSEAAPQLLADVLNFNRLWRDPLSAGQKLLISV